MLDLEVLDPKQVEGHRKPSRLDADPIGYGLVVVVRCLISKLVDDFEGLIRSGYHHQGVTRIKGKGLCFNSPLPLLCEVVARRRIVRNEAVSKRLGELRPSLPT